MYNTEQTATVLIVNSNGWIALTWQSFACLDRGVGGCMTF